MTSLSLLAGRTVLTSLRGVSPAYGSELKNTFYSRFSHVIDFIIKCIEILITHLVAYFLYLV